MNKYEHIEKMKQEIRQYAKGRVSDVARGAETPHLAGLIVQKYGYGIADAANIVYGNDNNIYQVVDEEVAKIDPNWKEHMKERWEGRPADVHIKKP